MECINIFGVDGVIGHSERSAAGKLDSGTILAAIRIFTGQVGDRITSDGNGSRRGLDIHAALCVGNLIARKHHICHRPLHKNCIAVLFTSGKHTVFYLQGRIVSCMRHSQTRLESAISKSKASGVTIVSHGIFKGDVCKYHFICVYAYTVFIICFADSSIVMASNGNFTYSNIRRKVTASKDTFSCAIVTCNTSAIANRNRAIDVPHYGSYCAQIVCTEGISFGYNAFALTPSLCGGSKGIELAIDTFDGAVIGIIRHCHDRQHDGQHEQRQHNT